MYTNYSGEPTWNWSCGLICRTARFLYWQLVLFKFSTLFPRSCCCLCLFFAFILFIFPSSKRFRPLFYVCLTSCADSETISVLPFTLLSTLTFSVLVLGLYIFSFLTIFHNFPQHFSLYLSALTVKWEPFTLQLSVKWQKSGGNHYTVLLSGEIISN